MTQQDDAREIQKIQQISAQNALKESRVIHMEELV